MTTYIRNLKIYGVSILLLALLLFAGCSGTGELPVATDSTEPNLTAKWKVTATTGMVADIVANIAGEHAEITQLMGPGVDPHLYKASQGDIKRIDEADIIFYSGLYLEGKMGEIFEQMSKKKQVIAVAEDIPADRLQADPGAPDQPDPHVWFDGSLWMMATEKARDALIQFDPAHENDYRQNAEAYLSKLEELHQYALEQIALIPEEQRVLVTAHDAFGYFGKAYNIEVMGLQGISTASEYGLKDVQELVDTLVDRKIKAVFLETSIPPRSIEAVVQGAQAKNHTVLIGGELYSDAMGEVGTPEGTYIGMVKYNVDTIVSALK